jgi:hypothetical protein
MAFYSSMSSLIKNLKIEENNTQTFYTSDLIANIDETGINLGWSKEGKVVTIDEDDCGEVVVPNFIGNITFFFIVFANGTSLPPVVLWLSKTLLPEVRKV